MQANGLTFDASIQDGGFTMFAIVLLEEQCLLFQ
jgi:hypothetical protein